MRSWAVVVALAGLAACSRAPRSLGEAELPTLGGGVVSPASCPTEKCLTVYVAPWCGYCRAATPQLIKLRTHLEKAGVSMRFIVGMDEAPAVEDYAAVFGPEALLDPRNAFGASGGVPHFYVTDKGGRVLRDLAGMPRLDSVQDLAEYFGLP